jgi:D-galactarolactone cycloisomerase
MALIEGLEGVGKKRGNEDHSNRAPPHPCAVRHGAAPTAFAGMNLTSVDSLFVRVCTDAGVDGLGEGWGHGACPTTSAALTTLVGPPFIGRDVPDRSRLMTEMSHRFHIHGRMGPVVYALSAIQIALWDIAGKLASLPVASLLGGAPRELTAYASLLR